MNNARSLTQGALMLSIYLVLLLITIYIPVLSIIANLFLVLPFLLYSAKFPIKKSILLFFSSIILTAVVGTIVSIPLTILYGATGLAMGICINLHKSKVYTYIVSSFVFLASLLIEYIGASVFFNMNFIDDFLKMTRKSFQQSVDLMSKLGQPVDSRLLDSFDTMISLVKILMPSLLVSTSFILVFIFIQINFPIARRFKIDVPAFRPFRQMQLPKSLLWYYLITVIFTLTLGKLNGNFVNTALLNIAFMLQFLMLLQGISLVLFISHSRNIPKPVPIAGLIIIAILFFPALYMVSVLGVLDLGFNIRQRFQQKP
ncbi:YybS family protein [Falsibacillus albus]|uniref:DUF2232 domain-containing protein n=1 Tax=Falsibacillus albus TaxID=2478915 RepID=A0A3L7JT23_9BACI|nr:YybS family protein [Falsibacillus albus]RLQ93983.1 DUF2232 domain-containing protein [Falsibacillus albus]